MNDLTSLPPRILLELEFECQTPVSRLPYYHGPQWNGLFRPLLKDRLPPGLSMADAGISVLAYETGITAYGAGDLIRMGLAMPDSYAPQVLGLLGDFNDLPPKRGHFQPGKSIKLKCISCRVSNAAWSPNQLTTASPRPLCWSDLQGEKSLLHKLETFHLQFWAPLRLKRPLGAKSPEHTYVDSSFLQPFESTEPLQHIINSVRLPGQPSRELSHLQVQAAHLIWIDNKYGKFDTPMGGVVGRVKVSGRPGNIQAARLTAGQYWGIGKNHSFGLGYYLIPELASARKLLPPQRGSTFMERAVATGNLASALENLPNSSPGPDDVSKQDLQKSAPEILEKICGMVLEKSHKHGTVKTFSLPKKDGGYREVTVQNMCDRLLQRAIADILAPSVDSILSSAAYAYRKGLNRQAAAKALKEALAKGYSTGVKADIQSFFPSLNHKVLSELLYGLFPFDPLPGFLMDWLSNMKRQGIQGLPQGSPCSPVLSNLYLDCFDKDMAAQGFKLIRYGDDFALLFKSELNISSAMDSIAGSLKKLGLQLNPKKTEEITLDRGVHFLGYTITPDDILSKPQGTEAPKDDWPIVFKDQWYTGQPVYLSPICRGAYSSGPYLIIKTNEEERESLHWNEVSRLVVVGRSSFSGGVVYRAVREQIPVTFIDIMGVARGQLFPEVWNGPSFDLLQRNFANDPASILEFAREIVSAKIHNQWVLLRRNGLQIDELKELGSAAVDAKDIDQLRGFEGAAGRCYFSHFANLVEPFNFAGRTYRPPKDQVNAMLSLGYTLLYNRLASALASRGFNTRQGFMHQSRGRHQALASDLMEEFRHMIDRVVLALIHRKEIKPEDFSAIRKKDLNTWRLSGDGFRKFIRRFEHSMAAKFTYHGGEPVSGNAYLDEIAAKLSRTLKLEIPYKALRIK